MGQPNRQPRKSCEYGTPDWIFDPLNQEFQFTVDPASSELLYKCERHWTKKEDGLAQKWRGERLFINPPFDAKDLKLWVPRAYEEFRISKETVSVMLVPVKSDQSWWHEYALKAERRFIKGRVRFEGTQFGSPIPVCVLVFENGRKPIGASFTKHFGWS